MKTPVGIRILETAFADGMHANVASEPSLPNGYYCRIVPRERESGTYTRITRAKGNGSIRYHFHRSYEEAIRAGEAWVRRKERETRKYREELAAKAAAAPKPKFFFESGN